MLQIYVSLFPMFAHSDASLSLLSTFCCSSTENLLHSVDSIIYQHDLFSCTQYRTGNLHAAVSDFHSLRPCAPTSCDVFLPPPSLNPSWPTSLFLLFFVSCLSYRMYVNLIKLFADFIFFKWPIIIYVVMSSCR